MSEASVVVPVKNDLGSIFNFARELDDHSRRDRLSIDFGAERFFSPFEMLFLSAKLQSLRTKNPKLAIEPKNQEAHPYLAHVGFFKMCGFDHGRDVGEARGNDNYVPITRVEREEFYEKPDDKFEELPDLIQRHADKLALMIARDKEKNGDLFDLLSYSVREVMRNVFEHSKSDSLCYCAQYWPKSNKVEFAVADFGIGIRQGLAENPNFRFDTDKEAIETSLLPGVSGKTHAPRRSANWFNSGYGLYMTSKLARNGGNFVLASGNAAVHLSRANKNNYQTSFPGTALRFNMDVAEIGNVSNRLEQFRKEGAELAKTVSGSGNRPPSAPSLLLRRDFEP